MPVTFEGGVVSSDDGALDAFGGAGDPVGYGGSGYGTFNPNEAAYMAPESNVGIANAAQALASMPTDQLTQLSMPQAVQAQNLFDLAAQGVPSSGVRNLGFVQSRTPNYNMYTQPFNMPQPADIRQALTDFERNLGLRTMGRAADRMTTVTGMGTQPSGFAQPLGTAGAMTMSSLDQLGRRAGGSGAFAQTPSSRANQFGSSMAAAMYSDIADKGYIPQYDSRGQIVATINPETGQYGKGSVEARIDFNNPDTQEELQYLQSIGVDIPQRMSVSDDEPQVFGAPAGQSTPAAKKEEEKKKRAVIAAGGTPMYRLTLLDEAPQMYGGLLADQTAADFNRMNRDFRLSGATYPEYYTDPYSMEGYSILS